MHSDAGGETFHEAWVTGVKQHYPGQPKDSYVVSWQDAPEWERASAVAVYQQVRAFIEVTGGAARQLTRDQKGRFVALCWIGQMHKYFPEPKPSYVTDWDDLPQWHRETDADIFERVELDGNPVRYRHEQGW